MTSFTSLTSVPLTIYGMCIHFLFLPIKHNLTCTWCTTFNILHLYLMSSMLESSYSQKRN